MRRRPPDAAYREITRPRYSIERLHDDDAIAYDRRSDGMRPLMSLRSGGKRDSNGKS